MKNVFAIAAAVTVVSSLFAGYKIMQKRKQADILSQHQTKINAGNPVRHNEVFVEAWTAASATEFKSSWHNGTGYFNDAVSVNHPAPIMSAYTGPVDDRRILFVRTPIGNVVIFDRYTAGANAVVVCNHNIKNTPENKSIRDMLAGSLTEADVRDILALAE